MVYLPCIENQSCWNNILYPSSSIAPCYTNQELQRVRRHRHTGRGDQSQEREENSACKPGVRSTLGEEQGLEVVGEGQGDDGEVGGQGEHREQGEEEV